MCHYWLADFQTGFKNSIGILSPIGQNLADFIFGSGAYSTNRVVLGVIHHDWLVSVYQQLCFVCNWIIYDLQGCTFSRQCFQFRPFMCVTILSAIIFCAHFWCRISFSSRVLCMWLWVNISFLSFFPFLCSSTFCDVRRWAFFCRRSCSVSVAFHRLCRASHRSCVPELLECTHSLADSKVCSSRRILVRGLCGLQLSHFRTL